MQYFHQHKLENMSNISIWHTVFICCLLLGNEEKKMSSYFGYLEYLF